MNLIFIIAVGGAIGAVCRYLLSSQIAQVAGTQFPWGILIVNVVGGFFMGAIAGLGAQSMGISQETRTFLTTGVLGGVASFPALSLGTALLIERGDIVIAAAYVLSSVIGSGMELCLGLYIIRMVAA